MIYNITIKGTEQVINVESNEISNEVSAYIFQKGLEAVINGRGRTKLGKPETYTNVEAYEAECMRIAEAQAESIKNGSLRMVGASKKGAKGAEAAVKTEMMNVARRYAK